MDMIQVTIQSAMAKRNIRFATELAKQSGINYAHLRLMMSGNIKQVKLATIERLCQALDCQPGDLFSYCPDDKVDTAQMGT